MRKEAKMTEWIGNEEKQLVRYNDYTILVEKKERSKYFWCIYLGLSKIDYSFSPTMEIAKQASIKRFKNLVTI